MTDQTYQQSTVPSEARPFIGEAVQRLTARISQLPDESFAECWTALGTIVRAVCLPASLRGESERTAAGRG